MKLWLIRQNFNQEWDTYDSAVVAAPDEDAARRMRPRWTDGHEDQHDTTWAEPEHVVAELIGEGPQTEPCVICASFNAG